MDTNPREPLTAARTAGLLEIEMIAFAPGLRVGCLHKSAPAIRLNLCDQ